MIGTTRSTLQTPLKGREQVSGSQVVFVFVFGKLRLTMIIFPIICTWTISMDISRVLVAKLIASKGAVVA